MNYWQTKTFKTKEAQQKWIDKNSTNYQIVEVFVNNGYAVDYRSLIKL